MVLGRLDRLAQRVSGRMGDIGGFGGVGGGPSGEGGSTRNWMQAMNRSLAAGSPNSGRTATGGFKPGTGGAMARRIGAGVAGGALAFSSASAAGMVMAPASVLMGGMSAAGAGMRGYKGDGAFGSAVRGVGGALSVGAGVVGMAAGMGAAGLSYRYDIARQKAGAQFQMNMARMYGAKYGLGSGASRGFAPGQAAGMAEQFGSGAGFEGAFGGMGTFQYRISAKKAIALANKRADAAAKKEGVYQDLDIGPRGEYTGGGSMLEISEQRSKAIRSNGIQSGKIRKSMASRTRTGNYSIYDLARTGIPLDAFAGYRGTLAAGAGGTGQTNLAQMAGRIQSEGLLGSKAAQYLGTIASATSRMAESGLTFDMGSVEQFIGRMQSTAGTKGTGLHQARAIQALGGAAVGARGKLFGGFRGVGESAVLAKALRAGGGLSGAGRAIEGMDSPGAIMDAIREFGGEDLAAQYLKSTGQSTSFAEAMANGLGPAGKAPKPRFARAGVQAAIAGEEARAFGMVSDKDASALIKDVAGIRRVMIELGGGVQKLIDLVRDYL